MYGGSRLKYTISFGYFKLEMYYNNTVADYFNMVVDYCNWFWIMLIQFCMR